MKIAFSGKMTAGKTISADFLVKYHGFKKIRFANPIYEIMDLYLKVYDTEDVTTFHEEISSLLNFVFPIGTKEYEQAFQNLAIDLYEEYLPIGKTIKFKDPNFRTMLQKIGTEKMRSIDPDVWVKFMAKTIEQNIDENLVIDDVRFLNEVQILKDYDFLLIRLALTPNKQKERLLRLYGTYDEASLTHVSETQIDNVMFDEYVNADLPLLAMLRCIEDLVIGGVQ